MGLGSDSCAAVLSNTLYANLAINAFLSANKACNVAIEQDKEKDPHFYSSCTCSQLKTTTNYGLQVSGYQYVESNGALFTADYPTSSPYVTSVGATQFLTDSSGAVTEEVACSILTGAIITTGGGFSLSQAAEDYQTQAVRGWSSNTSNPFPPSYSYDINNRAYPDVAFNGHNYLIYYSDSTSDNCPCSAGEVDGTSCSSPALAGMISLINDQLLNAGKPQLGFLNYLLYQMAEDQPSAFNDIVSGNNFCNRGWCCQYGYTAVPGWDPVSGLGSPNYQSFLNYVLQAKGMN
jgi:subtilase family serine protease